MKADFYHLRINIKDPKISFPFYKELFAYLNYGIIDEGDDFIGFTDKISDVWIIETDSDRKNVPFHRDNIGLNHLAFIVEKKEDVDKFTKEFLKLKNILPLYDSPKLFPEYDKDYYAVFFEDADKIKLEIVFRSPRYNLSKNLIGWHKKKIEISSKEIVPEFNQRDIWWCSLGLNIGYEEDGKNDEYERPVLVLKKFSKNVFIGLPLTSTRKDSPYYFPYTVHGEEGSILLSHPRLLDAKRLNRRLSKMRGKLFKRLKEEYINLYR